MSVTRLTCMNVVKKNKVYLFILAVLPVIIGLSFITINPHAFAFPANIIICFVSVYLSVLFGRLSESLRFFSGQKAVLTAFVCIILLMIVHWLFYHRRLFDGGFFPPALYDFSKSALFVFAWMMFVVVLGAVIVRRLTLVKTNNQWFLLHHFGLWFALMTGFLGSTDSYTMYALLTKETSTSYAYNKDGKAMQLPFQISLKEIQTEVNMSGAVANYGATVKVKDEGKEKTKTIAVNQPYRYKGYDIYIMQVANYRCKLQIVYDPWRYVVLLGILMMMTGALGMFFKGFKMQKQDDKLG